MHSHPASYRDNSGFIFKQDYKFYRFVSPVYETHYSRLMNSGLYEELVRKNKLIPHQEPAETTAFGSANGRVLLPEQLINELADLN